MQKDGSQKNDSTDLEQYYQQIKSVKTTHTQVDRTHIQVQRIKEKSLLCMETSLTHISPLHTSNLLATRLCFCDCSICYCKLYIFSWYLCTYQHEGVFVCTGLDLAPAASLTCQQYKYYLEFLLKIFRFYVQYNYIAHWV